MPREGKTARRSEGAIWHRLFTVVQYRRFAPAGCRRDMGYGMSYGAQVKNGTHKAAWYGLAECLHCGVRDLDLFADLEDADFHLIHHHPIDNLRVDPGAVLYHAGEPGGAVYTICSGLVKLVQYLPDSGQRIVRLLQQGDTAGLEVLAGEPYRHTAIVVQVAHACRIPRQVIETLSAETPRLYRQLMRCWQHALAEADAG